MPWRDLGFAVLSVGLSVVAAVEAWGLARRLGW